MHSLKYLYEEHPSHPLSGPFHMIQFILKIVYKCTVNQQYDLTTVFNFFAFNSGIYISYNWFFNASGFRQILTDIPITMWKQVLNMNMRIMKSGGIKPIITYVNAGIKCKEIEYRGKVILLVDSTFINDLKDELVLYESN